MEGRNIEGNVNVGEIEVSVEVGEVTVGETSTIIQMRDQNHTAVLEELLTIQSFILKQIMSSFSVYDSL